jgi:hypothetical protein
MSESDLALVYLILPSPQCRMCGAALREDAPLQFTITLQAQNPQQKDQYTLDLCDECWRKEFKRIMEAAARHAPKLNPVVGSVPKSRTGGAAVQSSGDSQPEDEKPN